MKNMTNEQIQTKIGELEEMITMAGYDIEKKSSQMSRYDRRGKAYREARMQIHYLGEKIAEHHDEIDELQDLTRI